MNSDELSLMTDDQIDYGNLSEKVLKELALGNDLFIATSALTELRIRKSDLAASVAWEILSQGIGDRYLKATALSVLFDTNQEQAINFMGVQVWCFDSYTLNTLMEIILENESEFKFEPASSIVQVVTERLKEFNKGEKFPDPDLKRSFLNRYGYGENKHAVDSADITEKGLGVRG